MSLFIASLNSGSNGNCYYIGNDQEAVLVDAGLSCKETEKRLKRMSLSMGKIKGIFVSHEHGDHIKGLEGLAFKYRIPVYITATTLRHSRLRISETLINSFKPYTPVTVGGLSILAFPKLHDAADPHSFVISCNGINIGVFTDIGANCEHVIANFRECHAVFLESNYDEEMLHQGRYPYHLKRRISGGYGHLSNRQALDLFMAHKPPFMSHLYLSHLSKDNNCPELASSLFKKYAGNTEVVIASRYEETGVYTINSSVAKTVAPISKPVKAVQASLF